MNREQLAATRAALVAMGATDVRVPLSTPAAVELARELAQGEAKHPDLLASALRAWDELAAQPAAEPDDFEATLAKARAAGVVADVFWEAFEGQTVDGAEIIRRRA